MAKQRADVLVVEQGLAETRSKAQALIIAGSIVMLDVTSGGERRVDKPGEMLAEGAVLRLKGEALRYVSRGENVDKATELVSNIMVTGALMGAMAFNPSIGAMWMSVIGGPQPIL